MDADAKLEKTEIQVGFIPILCSAPLILAHARGIFERNGLHVDLTPAPGWSGIKELMAYGKLDAAHMLSPMPLACNLGIDGKKSDILLAAVQNVNGQALTLAAKHLGIAHVADMKGFTFGVPYRFSMHYYLLCHHLARHGVDPLKDVKIVEVAPPNMPYYLQQGWVDGVFAPEPFNQIPVMLGTGFIQVLSKDIWEGHPCCSFATTRSFAEKHPNTYRALLTSILEAEMALHSADVEERRVIARSISDPAHLNLDDVLPAEQVLSGDFPDGKGGSHHVPDRIDFVPHAFVEYGTWMLTQMQRWGQLGVRIDYREVVESTFDSDAARDIAVAVGYSPDALPSLGAVGFSAEAPFASMQGQPFCAFPETSTSRERREISEPIRKRLAEISDHMAQAVGGRSDVTFTTEGDDELGRLEELLRELLVNTRFTRLLLDERNSKLKDALAKVEASNRDLDRRVAVRTSELEQQRAVLDGINQVLSDALACETEEEVAETCLRVAEELTGSRFGFIGEVNPQGTFDTIALSNPGWDACKLPHSNALVAIRGMIVRGIWGRTVSDGRSQIVNEPASHADRVGTPEGHPPLECFLGVPLLRAGKAVGMIALANREGGYTEQDKQAIEALSVPFYAALLRRRADIALEQQNAVKAAQAGMADVLRGSEGTESLCHAVITFLCKSLGCRTGLVYLASGDGTLLFTAGYAYTRPAHLPTTYKPGEGLVGQAALDGEVQILTDVPDNYITIGSGLGEMPPRSIYVKPVVHEGTVVAVLELGSMQELTPRQAALLDALSEGIAVAVRTAQAREKERLLLEQTQQQAEELQAQQEELRVANEELEEQTQLLEESGERLKAQQEELQVTNEELEEKNDLLQRQKQEVERARKEIETKAEEVALASKYKSEFLANMSHELRTPLNSLLLLAQDLAENKSGNLSDDQVEAAGVIHSSGSDLLDLINEILDLAKIEAGRIELHLTTVPVSEFAYGIERAFRRTADGKGLSLEVNVADDAPPEISTDRKRVDQVIRNLVSNAVKFTETGGVTITLGRPAPGVDLSASRLDPDRALAIAVRDTGIGIAPEQQKVVFEAFQQADGGTARRYGGTGLGLSISRELAALLGGQIQLESEPGTGSTFTLYLPLDRDTAADRRRQGGSTAGDRRLQGGSTAGDRRLQGGSTAADRLLQVADDRDNISADDTVVLVIEDDPRFAKVLYDRCHDRGVKCLAAATGEEGLALAGERLPGAIILDVQLPGMDGWTVLAALKEDTRTRHIPVHVISVEEAGIESLRRGAVGHATKPISREELDRAFERLDRSAPGQTKRVLLVEDDSETRRRVVQLIGGGEVELDEATTGEEAIAAMRATRYACLIVDLGLPDMDGGELLRRAQAEGLDLPPVIVHTARELTEEEDVSLRERAESIVIKDVRSPERLLDEVSLFLHEVVSRMPDRKKQMIRNLHETDVLLKDKTVLVVDDDMRTTFALSRLLAQRGMKPLKAGNGRQALAALQQNSGIDLVLMDIMMPVMDGYETMARIRAQEPFRKLPIIALTAKAMPQDRQPCRRTVRSASRQARAITCPNPSTRSGSFR